MTTKKTKVKQKKRKAVVVLDTHRGIYFGYLKSKSNQGKTVTLTGARHCFYYTLVTANEGTYGLATVGPQKGSKVGPRVDMTINDVSKTIDCTPDAEHAWEAVSWGG